MCFSSCDLASLAEGIAERSQACPQGQFIACRPSNTKNLLTLLVVLVLVLVVLVVLVALVGIDVPVLTLAARGGKLRWRRRGPHRRHSPAQVCCPLCQRTRLSRQRRGASFAFAFAAAWLGLG